MIEIQIHKKPTVGCAVYAPNDNNERNSFYRNIKENLSELEYSSTFIIGDFNGGSSPTIDKISLKTRKDKRKGTLPHSFFQLAQDWKLNDIWRRRNRQNRNVTYYSHGHNSFSRIDMCWASTDLLIDTKEIEILPKTLADPNPILWTIYDQPRITSGKLDPFLLKDKDFIIQGKKKLQEYFENKRNKGTSPNIRQPKPIFEDGS